MSAKTLTIFTSVPVTAGLAAEPLAASAGTLRQIGTWGRPAATPSTAVSLNDPKSLSYAPGQAMRHFKNGMSLRGGVGG